jgi:acyl-CoA synthetase (AMP-forming)/AMP-acid ligase II
VGSILEKFRDVVKRFPKRIAITHHLSQGRVNNITFNELGERSDQLADYLETKEIRKGEFVGIYMQKSMEHVVAILGILKRGAAFYSVNSKSKLPQLKHITSISNTRKLFIDNTTLLNFNDMRLLQGSNVEFIHYSTEKMNPIHQTIFDRMGGIVNIYQFIPIKKEDFNLAEDTLSIVKRDAALALFTSGSTGFPKGVMISHQDLFNRVLTECHDYQINEDDCLLSVLPFSFDVGCNQLFTSLSTGARLIILNSWLPGDICSAINEYKVTGISGVPAIWAGFLDYKGDEIKKAFSKVRYITISGGDMSPDHLRVLRNMLDGVSIYKTYGQTETFRSSILRPHEFENKMMTVGRPVKGTEVFILNKRREKAKANEIGEVIHRGDGMMIGYMGDPHGTRRKIRKNPLHDKSALYPREVVFTGDTGKIDEEGYLYILGRKDKMIKTSGYRVYPKEIIDQILTNEAVKDAIVFGIKDEKIGSSILAEVQLKKGYSISEREMKQFLSDRLPPYMIPSRIFFVEAFPRTSSGKIRLSEVEKKYNG